MLEEALKNERRNPNESAVAMLQFVQFELTAGGAAAEARFYNSLYGPLCDRIFGPILGKKNNYRHADGGWLASKVRPRLPPMVTAGANSNTSTSPMTGRTAALSRTSNSFENDPFVRLLATCGKPSSKESLPPTLIEAISNETENRPGVGYLFPFLGLPKPMQDSWLELIDASMGVNPLATHDYTKNDVRLMQDLLRKRPVDQRELLQHRRTAAIQKSKTASIGQSLQLSPRALTSPLATRSLATTVNSRNSPSTPTSGTKAESSGQEEDTVGPSIILSMLEYYLFVFVRFPLATPSPSSTSFSSSSNSVVQATSLGSPYSPLNQRMNGPPFGDTVYTYLFSRYVGYFLPMERRENRCITFDATTPESELFLRTVIAFWVESQTRIEPTARVVKASQDRRARVGLIGAPAVDLSTSYDLVTLPPNTSYEASPALVRKNLRKLIVQVMLDPSVRQLVERARQVPQQSCLSKAMTALQAPFYNYIRCIFRYGSIHSAGSSFFSALDLWLMWLEPWNAKMAKSHLTAPHLMSTVAKPTPKRELAIPKFNQKSNFTPQWEPFIAANLHMYVVPLAIFLRRARELDFSDRRFERSIQIVKKVFRVFDPNVVDMINRHLSGDGAYSNLVQHELENLGAFAPPTTGVPLTLESCKPHMHGLLEEIYMQHAKKVRELNVVERSFARLEGIFGKGVVSGEEKELTSLLERAKLIVKFPMDYEVFPRGNRPTKGASSATSGDAGQPVRAQDGLLTDQGRVQIVRGIAKCNPADVSFDGDKMHAIVGTYEIAILVKLFLALSFYLNKKLGWMEEVEADVGGKKTKTTKEGKVIMGVRLRVNLRFLADYRNIIFLYFVQYIYFKFWW